MQEICNGSYTLFLYALQIIKQLIEFGENPLTIVIFIARDVRLNMYSLTPSR